MGMSGIVDNAKDVIEANTLKGMIIQRELDHMNWASEISKLFTDETCAGT